MPLRQGVAENFIGILRTEDRATQRALLRNGILIVVLLLFAGLVVDLADGRFFGIGMGLSALAVAAGGAVGFLGGRLFHVRRLEANLARNWNRWMRYSVACSRLDEVQRRARGRPATKSVTGIAVLWTILLFATLILLLMTVVDGVPTVNKTPVFIGYGLYLGHVVGRTLALQAWVRGFLRSVDEMLRTGEIGLWGVV